MLIKTSILMDWVQIFVPRGTRGRFFWTCCGICCFNFLYYFSGEVASNLNCIPFERIWDKTIPGRCFDRTPLDLTTAAVNVVCDLVILVAPQRVIWRLHLTKQKRAGISIVFAIGLLAIVSAISRLAITVQNSRSSDFTFGMAKVALWSLAELTFSLLLFCIPVIPKAVKESTLPNPLLQMVRSSTSWFKASTGSGWSSSQLQKTPNRGRGYNHMNHEETSLSDLNTARMQPPDQINDVRSDVDRIQLGQGGITLTREFIATEERQDNKEGRLEPEDYHELWDSGRV
ncbi:hypothetical protein GGR54DRAFT_605050 [Hypoxylon sp. NC1633]|nr:hypothetical protein GGR54DRAFT_605050 [Hypoxylon sp. NC1633]